MNQIHNVRPVLRFVAAIALSTLSYAAMAQAAPSVDTCSQTLSSFQKRLYAHFMAGPDSLRSFVFRLRAVRQLDVRDVDAWARRVAAQGCPERDAAMPADEDETVASTPASPLVVSVAADAEGPDGCSVNVLDVMHCNARSERTREAVVAELRNARAAGELATVGELSDAQPGIVVPRTTAMAATRAQVRQALALAQAAHEMPFGER